MPEPAPTFVNHDYIRERKEAFEQAYETLGLHPAIYGETFEEIAQDWKAEGMEASLRYFFKPEVAQLCKSPADFKRAASIVKPLFRNTPDIARVIKEIIQLIGTRHITNLYHLEYYCTIGVDTYKEISDEWNSQSRLSYMRDLYPEIQRLCSSPEDFKEASRILLRAVKGIYGYGSSQFVVAVIEELQGHHIQSLAQLEEFCIAMVNANDELKRSPEYKIDPNLTDGTQFKSFAPGIRFAILRITDEIV